MRPLLIASVAALALAGCGLGPGTKRPGGAQLRVTRDFGTRKIASASSSTLRDGQTVMRFLTAEQPGVETRYGGRFVTGIAGVRSTVSGGHSDWFYFVNGIEAQVGAAERTLHPGDVVQWDFHRWDAAMDVPAIVGAFPEPFVHGSEGERFPVRIECGDHSARACSQVADRMAAVKVPAGLGTLGAQDRGGVLRLVVAPWTDLRRLGGALVLLERGPGTSGVFARFDRAGHLDLLDAHGRVSRRAQPGTGIVAALGRRDGQPLWVVSGVDEKGTERAAAALTPELLRDAFAVAVPPSGIERLPLASAG